MHERGICRSALTAVCDVWCDDQADLRSDEEQAVAGELIIPRSGMFVRAVEGRRVLANPAVAMFYNLGEVGWVEHPGGHGDANTVLTLRLEAKPELVDPNGRLPTGAVGLSGTGMGELARLCALPQPISRPRCGMSSRSPTASVPPRRLTGLQELE